MSTLHERLLAWLGPKSGDEGMGPWGATRAVLELHAPVPCPGFPCLHLDPHTVCKTCGSSGTYVIGKADSTACCSTTLAIAEALEIGETPK